MKKSEATEHLMRNELNKSKENMYYLKLQALFQIKILNDPLEVKDDKNKITKSTLFKKYLIIYVYILFF